MGTGKKRERMNNDEIEMRTERRRSSRIVALEEKRKQEKEKKLAAKKNKIDTKNKEKGKAVIDAGDINHLDDFVEDQKLTPTYNKGWKDRAFYQLISTFKAIQERRPINDESTSVANVSSLNRVPDKHVLESVLDLLQRKDCDEMFGEPISLNTVENWHLNVNEPMDFGTIRAKVHDGMYTTLEQFKRDVYLICFNAMNAYPKTSRYYKVAKGIGCHAVKIFESLSGDLEHFDLEVSFNKRQSKKQLGTSQLVRASTKPTGRNGTRYKVPKTDKRVMYQPPNNNSLLSEVLNCTKSNLQLNTDSSNYKESLLRFVKDLGPTAQNIAAKKLEALNSQQLQDANTSNPTQITHQLTPKPLTQPPITHNSSQKPLTIPGVAPQQNRISNTIPSSANIRNNTDNWQSYAAALMYNSVYNNNTDEKGKNQIGVESSNARGTMDTTSYAFNGNMASRVENTFNYIRQQNTSGSSNNLPPPTYLHPSRMIPILRPQSNPLNSISSNRLSSRPFEIPPAAARPIIPSINSSRLGVMSQPMPSNFDNNTLRNSLLASPMGYSRPMNLVSGMNYLSSGTLLNSQAANQFPNESRSSLFNLNTPYHPGDFQAMMNSTEFNNSYHPMQVNGQMNLIGPSTSSNSQVPFFSNALSYNRGSDALETQQERATSQLLDNDDPEPNLILRL